MDGSLDISLRELVAELWRGKSIGRSLLNFIARDKVVLSGRVLDLGSGAGGSHYRFIKQEPATSIISVDMNYNYRADIVATLESPLPVKDAVGDVAMLFNCLYLVYHYQLLIEEIHRVLKPNGKVYIAAPFLFGFTPEPADYFRYTETALDRILKEKFTAVEIISFGGLFLAAINLLNVVIKVRLFRIFTTLIALGLDQLLTRFVGSRNKRTYPIGYLVIAEKGMSE